MDNRLDIIERKLTDRILDLQYITRKLIAELDRTGELEEISHLEAAYDKINAITRDFGEMRHRFSRYGKRVTMRRCSKGTKTIDYRSQLTAQE